MKCCFWTNYESIIHSNSSWSEKVHLLLSHIKIHPHIWLEVFACKWCSICAYFSPDSDKTTFSTEKARLSIEDSYFYISFKVKNVLIMDLFITNTQLSNSQKLTDELVSCGLLFCFISSLDSHSDGTHSL